MFPMLDSSWVGVIEVILKTEKGSKMADCMWAIHCEGRVLRAGRIGRGVTFKYAKRLLQQVRRDPLWRGAQLIPVAKLA